MKFFFTFLLNFLFILSYAQKSFSVGHYNLENLFDTIDQPQVKDEEFLPNGKNQWNSERYIKKLNRMSQAIAGLNDGKGLAILGVCEVENEQVLKDLVKQKSIKKFGYQVAHINSRDPRGIDVAFLYQPKMAKLVQLLAFQPDRFADSPFLSRPILLFEAKTSKGTLYILENHWPSRSGGTEISAPRRLATAKLLAHLADSLERANPSAQIIAMGDFNDEPTDVSMQLIKNATHLINAMESWPKEEGTHFYQKEWSKLDQILYNQAWNFAPPVAKAEKLPFLLEQEGKFKGNPFRTYVGPKYLGGYSDHLPVTMKIIFQ